MKNFPIYLDTLATFLPPDRELLSLTLLEVQEVFLSLSRAFFSSAISVDVFSGVCELLWHHAESLREQSDHEDASELADILLEASELSWYSRNAVENYPLFYTEVRSFFSFSSQKKSARTVQKKIDSCRQIPGSR